MPLAEVRDELARELALHRGRASGCRPSRRSSTTSSRPGPSLAEAAAAVGLEAKYGRGARCARQRAGRRAPGGGCPTGRSSSSSRSRRRPARPALLEETEAGSYFVLQVDEVDAAPESSRSTRSGRSWSRAGRPSSGASWRASAPTALLTRLKDGVALDALAAAREPDRDPDRAASSADAPGSRSGHQPGRGAGAVRDPAGRGRRRGGRARRRLRGGRDRRGHRGRPGRRSRRRSSGSRPSSRTTCGATCWRSSRPSCGATIRSRSTAPRSTA